MGGIALARNDESNQNDHCDARNTCDAIGLGVRHEAVVLGNVATVTLVAGAAVLVGGIVLFATAPPRREENGPRKGAPGSKVAAFLRLSPGGAQLIGQW